MRFHRSFPSAYSKITSGSPYHEASDTPPHLASKIIHSGYGVIGTWVLADDRGSYDEYRSDDAYAGYKFGMSPQEYSVCRDYPDEPFLTLNRDQFLTFCESIGVHPAHLVPFDTDPRLSLPRVVLESNLYIMRAGEYSSEEKMLAKKAIDVEKERFARLLGAEKNSMGGAVLSLVEKFIQSQTPTYNEMFSRVFLEVNTPRKLRAPEGICEQFNLGSHDGARDILSLLLERIVVLRDRKNFEAQLAHKEASKDFSEGQKKVVGEYLNVFSSVEPDATRKGQKFVAGIEKYIQMYTGRTIHFPTDGMLGVLRNMKGKEIRELELNVSKGTGDESLHVLDRKLRRLAEIAAQMMFDGKFKNEALSISNWDTVSYAPDIDALYTVQKDIDNGNLKYVARLVANQYVFCQRDKAYSPYYAYRMSA